MLAGDSPWKSSPPSIYIVLLAAFTAVCSLFSFSFLLTDRQVLCYIFCYVLYNLYFHPLRNFPGPRLYAALRLPYTVNILSGNPHFVVADLHEEYGPVVRIAPDELAFAGQDAWRDIYGTHDGKMSLPKSPSVRLKDSNTFKDRRLN